MWSDYNPKPGVLFQPQSDPSRDVTKCQPVKKHISSDNCSGAKGLVRKAYVRNTEMSVCPTVYRTDNQTTTITKNTEVKSIDGNKLFNTSLSAPNLNSALRIVKEMKETAKLKPSPNQCSKLVDEEKILNKVNFPYEEHLYHDLVALSVSDEGVSSIGGISRPSARYRTRQRDKEPELSQFFTPGFSEEPVIQVHKLERVMNPLAISDSLSIYNRLRTWDVLDSD